MLMFLLKALLSKKSANYFNSHQIITTTPKEKILEKFKPRVRPDFSRGFYVSSYKLIKVVFTRPNIANNDQK